jgi:hypothetical protein
MSTLHSVTRNEIWIVLTATCFPRPQPHLVVCDPEERLTQYLGVLEYVCGVVREMEGVRVLVAENSGVVVERLRESCERLGAVYHASPPAGEARGKGWDEFQSLRHALEAQKLACNEQTVIFKITGRLRVDNLGGLVRGLQGDAADVWIRLREKGFSSDTRAFAFRMSVFPRLAEAMEALDEVKGVYFEHCAAKAVYLARWEGKRWGCFAEGLRIVGVSGSTGEVYGGGWVSHCVETLKQRLLFWGLGRRCEWGNWS